MVTSEDFFEHLKKEKEEFAKKPLLERVFLNTVEFIWYRVILRIKDWPQEIKWKYQGIVRGYSDADLWDLNNFILRKSYKPLKAFIKNYEEFGMSLPNEFATDPAAWLLILKKMEFAFDSYWSDEYDVENKFTKGMTPEQIAEHFQKVEEGFTLWGKHMRDLWD